MIYRSMTYREGLSELLNILAKEGNMTNGDVIKEVFPNIEFTDHPMFEYGFEGNEPKLTADPDWWNAPYKREVEK